MAVARPLKLPPRPTGLARVISRRNLPTLSLAVIALALTALIGRDVFFPPTTNLASTLSTFTVASGTVTNSVSASGTLVPAQQMNLGFKTAGTLTEVDVRSGDHVVAGQVLAKIDTSSLQLALQSAQASLASAQASLSNTLSGTALQQSLDSLNQARQSYTDAVNAAAATNSADSATTSADQATLNSDTVTLNNDKAAYWYMQYTPALTYAQGQVATAQAKYVTDGCGVYPQPAACAADTVAIQNAQNGVSCIQGGGAGCTGDQQQIASAYKAVGAAQTVVNADNAKVSADQARANADYTAGQRSIEQAQNAATNAQDAYNNQSVNRPATIQQQQAQVSSASALVDTAQANLDASVLTAPVAGVISSLSAQVGDTVSAANASSGAEVPGSTALLPSSGSSSNASGASSGFMTLMSDKSYVAVVSFAESDAAKVAAGQTGSLTFDAISGLTVPVHVLAVAAASTVSSNVVNYYVTLALDNTSSQLKPGLTSNATVITARAANVLVVPNRAITRLGNQATVTVLEAGKKVVTQVTLGIAGTSSTEIMAGLTAGQKVVLPTAKTPTGTTPTGRGFGGGGGQGIITGGG
jgi:multidrug efflux pump subunit AcrA (membrane-fusion protein)